MTAQHSGNLGPEDWQPTERSGRAELEPDEQASAFYWRLVLTMYVLQGPVWAATFPLTGSGL